jgi:hypothetical protein
MNILSQLIIGFIALLHIYILWLEMFAWTTRGRKVFKTIPEDQFEKTKDAHGLEIAHTLRYAAGNIVAYMVHVCLGPEKAAEVLPEVWKAVVHERFDEYRKEHLNAD